MAVHIYQVDEWGQIGKDPIMVIYNVDTISNAGNMILIKNFEAEWRFGKEATHIEIYF